MQHRLVSYGRVALEDRQRVLRARIITKLSTWPLLTFDGNDHRRDILDTTRREDESGRRAKNPAADPSSCARSGGWSFGTQKFKDVSSTRYARQTFIYSAIPYLRDRDFDGLDIDWEYPKGGDDKKNYVLLLKGKDDSARKGERNANSPRLEMSEAHARAFVSERTCAASSTKGR